MALDESKLTDMVFEDDVILVADKDLLSRVGDINVDFNGMGFNLSTEIPLVKASMSCGGCSC